MIFAATEIGILFFALDHLKGRFEIRGEAVNVVTESSCSVSRFLICVYTHILEYNWQYVS